MFLKNFMMAFVPLFVAVDAIGILPLFLGLTKELDRSSRQRILKQSMVTALCVAIGFVFVGKSIVLVAIAVMMVRNGFILLIEGMSSISP
jgi:multiple antibiotic resistance protein